MAVIGNGLAVIGGQTILPAIGSITVTVSLLRRAEGSRSEGIGLLFQNIAPAVVGIGIALVGVFVVFTDQLSQLVIGVLIIHRAALGNGLNISGGGVGVGQGQKTCAVCFGIGKGADQVAGSAVDRPVGIAFGQDRGGFGGHSA